MALNNYTFLFLIPTAIFFLAAFFGMRVKEKHPKKTIFFGTLAIVTSILFSVFGAFWINYNGSTQSILLGFSNLGFSLRIDSLSMIIYGMIALLAWFVYRFSINYLEGDKKQGVFLAQIALAVSFVQLLVLSGNLVILFIAWSLMSYALHRLLMFYSDRPRARIAAKKKFLSARLSDVLLILGVVLLYLEFQTGDIAGIFEQIKTDSFERTWKSELGTLLLVLSAASKSVQFPTHPWIIEVMETPTPVSALLHAGLLNAGPFLMIRMSPLLESVGWVSYVLIVMGFITALFGTIVYTTQTSIKIALSYSSVAHMGFTMMLCGFGVYSAALLHLVSHSFYKAHAFLSSGSVVERTRILNTTSIGQKSSMGLAVFSFIIASSVFLFIAAFWGVDFKEEMMLLVVGMIFVQGLTSLLGQTILSKIDLQTVLAVLGRTVVVSLSFLVLEECIHLLIQDQIPVLSEPESPMLGLLIMVFLLFFVVNVSMLSRKVLHGNSFWSRNAVHFRNGLYINQYLDSWLQAAVIRRNRNNK